MDGADAGLGAAATPLQPGAGAEQVIEIIHEKKFSQRSWRSALIMLVFEPTTTEENII